MTQTLTGSLLPSTQAAILGGPIMLEMSIGNETGAPVQVSTFEPTHAPADRQWPCSLETYKVSVLMSAGILAIALCDAGGEPVAGKGLAPWITPLLGKAALAPGDALRLTLRIDELFELRAPGAYRVQVEFHDGNVTAEALLAFEIKLE